MNYEDHFNRHNELLARKEQEELTVGKMLNRAVKDSRLEKVYGRRHATYKLPTVVDFASHS